MFEDATFAEIMDDLASRFIINVPEEELQEIARICFQIEQAHWFYEDFVREENTSLPSMTLKTFAGRMFRHCPLLSQWAHDSETAYQTFLDYKFKVPVCGAIILNPTLDKVVLVKGWNSRSSWGFPRGKINKDEPEWQCAQREAIEETGFDILPYLVEKQKIEITQADQKVVLYIITGIPEDTEFMPTTRKEISQVQWHWIDDLPCAGKPDRNYGNGNQGSKAPADKEHRYYLIKPFIKRIKVWVAKHPEKIGMPAVVVNPDGRPPLMAPTNTGVAGSRPGSVVTHTSGSNVMSVQELFNTVGKKRAPQSTNSSNSPLPSQQNTKYSASSTDGGSVSLLQALMGANPTLSDGDSSANGACSAANGTVNGRATEGRLTLSGFAFDTQRIMNAYRAHGS
ncbi:mRNA-decapping enzyme subunit 2 [Coemansia sp. RSA 1813]|nr:mRNA-decapping enzyme subunit 2 [Coemansia sp. RSA 1646]KAJ1773144.1 mRNA-decapping enzyme subunit 2 [Coemansia sp. RSA 1843]KAJ2092022.1 mRNA-decapping enzyme subunit 2 [Coemansia sp. RSA 986]KAJ2216642.1 mRNA-decapping enzyme subunit 2 [Coemansia sp. RSA 487]KAJ2572073.1 mRNA-decapping enzyme subunit 2 [Coemansia sp. RSA 1813]